MTWKSQTPRFQIPFAAVRSTDTPDEALRAWLRHPAVAAVQLQGAAVTDAGACRALAAAIHSEAPGLPPLVVLSPHGDTAASLPADLRPPDPHHLTLDLASGGEDFEVTLKVMTWGRRIAELGVDLVLSPRLDRSLALADPQVAARLAAAWTEALLAAGLVACAGPCASEASAEDEESGWAPFGQAVAHGLEAIHLAAELAGDEDALRRSVENVRQRADRLVIVGPATSDVSEIRASLEAGVDLVPLAASLAPEEIDAVLGEFDDVGTEPAGLVDCLREDWLL